MTGRTTIEFWLALLHCPSIGYQIFAKIISEFSNLADFFGQGVDFYKQRKLHPEAIHYLLNPDWKAVDRDLKWLDQAANHSIVTLLDKNYPPLLKEIANPPPVLFCKGDLEVLTEHQIAIVGSRNPSPAGKDISQKIASSLAECGLVITSGLACGIDTKAHLGALEKYKTIAVIGTGIDIVYPKSNRSLAEKIIEKGVIVSEFSTGTPPHGHNFPRRNRIISGLSLGVLVVEANLKSGSLITAQYALEQGREIFAVPGSIQNPRTQGCHALIKQGAKLVTGTIDVLEELLIFNSKLVIEPPKTPPKAQKTLDGHHLKLLECVAYEPTRIDVLVERSQYSIQEVTSILVDLELAEFISSTACGYIRVS